MAFPAFTPRQNQQLNKSDGTPIRVLVVDDEAAITDLLTLAVEYEGWQVQAAHTGFKALQLVLSFKPDLIVLDIMLPDIDGFDVLSRLRSTGNDTPVLFLTAKDALQDRIKGITSGADDYVNKPFSLEEVIARLRAVIRRSNIALADENSTVLKFADLELDEVSYEVRRGDVAIDLTVTEFELLKLFMLNPRRVLSKAQILDRVWNYDFGGKASIVELYVSYLRKKLDVASPQLIHTVRGVGYVLRVE